MARRRLLVALVLDGRDGAEVDGLRRALGSRAIDRIPPHVTLVPPLNLEDDALARVESHLRDVSARFAPVALSLGGAATFHPVTPVIYLRVQGDLKALQEELESGPLLRPPHREERPFVAHVTLQNHASVPVIDAALFALARYERRVVIDRVTLFQQVEDSPRREWVELSDYPLGEALVTGRGGRELTFQPSRQLTSVDRAFLNTEPGSTGEHDSQFVLRVETDRAIVGICRCERSGRVLEIAELLVKSDSRRQGIGRQLLDALARYARDDGVALIEAHAPASLSGLFEACGYRKVTTYRRGLDELVVYQREC
jgi:2'-5' RNA ligase/N-acetylglutamate synthase-like GNAT family acetyltransferase